MTGTFSGDRDVWRLPERDDALRGPEPLPDDAAGVPRQRAGHPAAAEPGHGSRFVDNVSAWQTVEPAIDFDAAAALALALALSA